MSYEASTISTLYNAVLINALQEPSTVFDTTLVATIDKSDLTATGDKLEDVNKFIVSWIVKLSISIVLPIEVCKINPISMQSKHSEAIFLYPTIGDKIVLYLSTLLPSSSIFG